MKKIIFLSLFCFTQIGFSQKVKKSSFMVMPHEKWMITNNFYNTVDNQGQEDYVFNYKKAILESPDLLPVVAKIEGILKERGKKLISLNEKINAINQDNAEKIVLQSKTSKAAVTENAFDKLMKTAKADVLVQIDWTVTTIGPKRQINFTLYGVDAYTNEPIAVVSDPGGMPSFEASLPVLLEEAVLKKVDDFLARIDAYNDDMIENGRKVKLIVEKFDSWNGDFEKEYNGKELREILEDWMRSNTVKGSFESTSGENDITFDARIPLFDENNNGIAATNFIRNLSKFLKAAPYTIENKLIDKYGLGKSKLILGEK